MKWYVAVFTTLNIIGLMVSLHRLGEGKWPIPRKPKEASQEAVEVVLHAIVIGWGAYLLMPLLVHSS